jgi:hypothetical protein
MEKEEQEERKEKREGRESDTVNRPGWKKEL